MTDALRCFYMVATPEEAAACRAWRCTRPATKLMTIDADDGTVPLCDDHSVLLIVKLHAGGHAVTLRDVDP